MKCVKLTEKMTAVNLNGFEMYSLEIQICNAMNDSNRVKEIFAKTAVLSNAIRDPRTMGIIYESGGKMYMKEKN